MTKTPSNTYGTIVKVSDASGTIVIDVWWNQDNTNNKNGQNGAIQCNSGWPKRLENEKSGITRIGDN